MAEATIYDVAERAGVSIATISNALNSPERVKPSTLKRIHKAIDELGFEPKAAATARARKTVGRIGVVAPLTTYPAFQPRLQGVIDGMRDQPYEVVIYDQESLAVRNDYLSHLPIKRHLDGLIVMSLQFTDEVGKRLLNHHLPTVVVDFAHPQFSSIEVDNYLGGQLAAQHLLDCGYQRCAFIGEQQISTTMQSAGKSRFSGYQQSLHDAGIALPDEYILLGKNSVEAARAQALQLLELPNRPDAVFAYSDIQAIGVLKAARERGLRVPDDLAVIGFDDIDAADYVGLSTVRHPLLESGQIAARLLLEHIHRPNGITQRVMLPISVVKRDTT